MIIRAMSTGIATTGTAKAMIVLGQHHQTTFPIVVDTFD
jgi:hypothetical protein